jgi:hypothetical protein
VLEDDDIIDFAAETEEIRRRWLRGPRFRSLRQRPELAVRAEVLEEMLEGAFMLNFVFGTGIDAAAKGAAGAEQ